MINKRIKKHLMPLICKANYRGISSSRLPYNRSTIRVMTVVLPFLLFACGGDVKEQLGLRKEAPDEFTVQRRPMLDVPPEFKIRPPVDEAEVRKVEAREETKKVVFSGAGNASAASDSFLNKLGVNKADANIREKLVEEYGSEDPTFLERVRSISDDNMNKTVVDAEKERERIAENIKQGKSAAEGETVSKPKSTASSVIDKLLGE